MSKINRVKLFTHNDLDGVGCAIMANLAYGAVNVDIEYCGYDDINESVQKFISNEEYNNYDAVYITDISITMGLADLIDSTKPSNFADGFTLGEKFFLLDHHVTAIDLNKFYWCDVKIYNNKEGANYKTCGTYMLYNYLQVMGELAKEDKSIYEFANLVRLYDTWEWKEVNNVSAVDLNNLLYIYGIDRFVSKFTNKLEHSSSKESNFELFDKMDNFLIETENNKMKNYIEKKSKLIVETTILGYKAGVIFAEQYISQLGNQLSIKNPHLDFIAIVNLDGGVSYRTVKDHVDLGFNVAGEYGGGGHAMAAGNEIGQHIISEVIGLIFQQ